jgi:hypothetical protein
MPSALVAALLLGAFAQWVLGDGPRSGSAEAPALPAWQLPGRSGPDLAKLDARWEARAPWTKAPEPDKVAAAVEDAPSPVPVGVARGKRGMVAIFSVPGGGDVGLAAGEHLPGGGTVTSVSGLSIEWTDARGQLQRHEMFNTYRVVQEEEPDKKPKRRR